MSTNRFQNSGFHQSGSDLTTNLRPCAGSFLVAAPSLQQTPFKKTVIFVLQHNQQGTFGVVLNRPADAQLKTAWQQVTGGHHGDRCFVQGGPIGGPVFAIHRIESLGEIKMPGGIFVSASSDKFLELTEQDDSAYRIVFGVAGWKQGQLADEINSGHWYQLEADANHVFDDPTWMWENFIRQYGRQILCNVVDIKHIHTDPWCN